MVMVRIKYRFGLRCTEVFGVVHGRKNTFLGTRPFRSKITGVGKPHAKPRRPEGVAFRGFIISKSLCVNTEAEKKKIADSNFECNA